MDFVVVGVGVGALGILLGVLLQGWLAARRERAAQRAVDPAAVAYERACAGEYRGGGQAFLAAGAAVGLATVGGIAGGLDDRSGALLVTTTATVAALGIIVWGARYRSRHPMPPRPRRQTGYASARGDQVVALDPEALAHVAEPAPAPFDEGPERDAQESEAPLAANGFRGHGEHAEPVAAQPVGGEEPEVEHDDRSPWSDDAALNGQPAAATDSGKILAFVGRKDRAQAQDVLAADGSGDDER